MEKLRGTLFAHAHLGFVAIDFRRAPKGDLVAYGRCIQNDNEIYWSDVEVASAADGQVNARGTVLYRIVK